MLQERLEVKSQKVAHWGPIIKWTKIKKIGKECENIEILLNL